MRPVVFAFLAFTLAPWIDRLLHDTNSDAAARRGVAEFQKKDYGPSIRDLQRAQQLKASPRNAFNLGTAQIAAGKREDGAAALGQAINDPATRADALYNRGNGALDAKAYEYAVRDYSDVLRMRPDDKAAKRNLEIALHQVEQKKKKEQQQQGGGGTGGPKQNPAGGPGEAPQPKPKPDQGQMQTPNQQQDKNGDALLRAIQQQENEELGRMKKARGQGRKIGW